MHNNNKHTHYTKIILLMMVLLFTYMSNAQNKKKLEKKRSKLRTEIKQINRLLSKTKKSEKNVLSQISDINKKIEVHQEIINTIQSESKIYSTEIHKNKSEIDSIEKQLLALKNEYAKIVVNSYKSKNANSKLLFLLSSKDFLQAYKRLKYMNQFADYRKSQAEEIVTKRNILTHLNDSILIKKKVKDSLVAIKIDERKVVDSEKAKKQHLLNKVKQKERKYLARIKAKQKKERAYEKQIENLITKVIRNSNKKTGKKSKGFVLTKEAKVLANSFTKNKGKLPAPVVKGYVSRGFGQRKHEVMKKLSVKSSGWYYTTAKKSKARAVFKGTVKSIMLDKKTKIKTVLVQHGNYMTVYGNLENLLVTEGDQVTTKQELGTIHTNTTTEKTILKFQLWKDAKAQNPSGWIYR